MATRSLCFFLVWLCVASALIVRASAYEKPFSCTGGAVYFSAHPVDGLLYQTPDLLHDLYVFKCVTTIVMTSGDRVIDANYSRSLERGLQEAYVLMAGVLVDDPTKEEKTMRVGTHDVHSWSLRGIPNIQIVYLRLPGGEPFGRGYDARGGESLTRLYRKEIDSVTSTDGNATYTLRDVKEIIAFILNTRKPNGIRMLNHKASMPKDGKHRHAPSDHTDHIVSAKLVQSVIIGEKAKANVTSYAGSVVRKFEANINHAHPDFDRKAAAYLKYASYDEQMCQSLEDCSGRSKDSKAKPVDDDVRYVSRFLEREYIVL